MNGQKIVTSAAMYFKHEQYKAIPLQWFERVSALFEENSLPITYFSADGGDFLIDDCHTLANRIGDLVKALKEGAVQSLGIDSPRSPSGPRSDWQVMADVSLIDGVFYLGIDGDVIANPRALVRHAYDIARGCFDICYGIAYALPLSQEPDSYAPGCRTYSFSEVRDFIRSRSKDVGTKGPEELWAEELNGRRRHLTGLFRAAYPASILSDAHMRTAGAGLNRFGKLSEIDASLWLWELSECEVPTAEKMLETSGVLVRQ
jgi:hypothetical protein